MDKQRVFLWAGFGILLFLLCTKTPLLSSIISLLLLGMIPGTNLVIPAWAILIVYPSLFVLVLFWLRRQSLFIGEEKKPAKQAVQPLITKRKKTKTAAHAKKTHATKRRARATV